MYETPMTTTEKIKEAFFGCLSLLFGLAFLGTICYIGLAGIVSK